MSKSTKISIPNYKAKQKLFFNLNLKIVKNGISLIAVFALCMLNSKYANAQDINCAPTGNYAIKPTNITVFDGYGIDLTDPDPCRIMDGDEASRWRGSNNGENQPFIIEFDLGSDKHLDQFEIGYRRTDRHYLFDIEVLGEDGNFRRAAFVNDHPVNGFTDDYRETPIPNDQSQPTTHSFVLKYRYKTSKIRYIAWGAEFADGNHNPLNEIREVKFIDTNTSPEEESEPIPTGDSVWSPSTDGITYNGNVGIGTSSPDAPLTVKGQIHTHEVLVDAEASVVPDYVFFKDYNLKTLSEVEEFIEENGHLPNFKSAEEFAKDGIELKKFNLKLLEKIEELTLYILQQEKRIIDLENQN